MSNIVRLPKITYDDGIVKATPDKTIKLSLPRMPFSATFAIFDGFVMLQCPPTFVIQVSKSNI